MNIEKFKIFDQMPGMYGCLSLNHQVIFLNQLAVRLTGFHSLEHAIGSTSRDMPCKASELADKLFEQDEIIFKKEISLQMIESYESYNGQMVSHIKTKSPYYDESNQLAGLLYHTQIINNTILENILKIHFPMKHDISSCSFYLDYHQYSKLLSKRQSECLFHLIRGKSCNDITNIFQLSKRTIESHLEEIKNKLRCSNKAQVIEKAIDAGIQFYIPKNLLAS